MESEVPNASEKSAIAVPSATNRKPGAPHPAAACAAPYRTGPARSVFITCLEADDGTVICGDCKRLPLASDPVLRSKQVLNTLLAGPVDRSCARCRRMRRSWLSIGCRMELQLPIFRSLGTSIPAGIESEQMAVDSISRTLEANVPQIRRLEDFDSRTGSGNLAGHLD